MTILMIILGFLFMLLLVFITTFNTLSKRQNQIKNSISSLDAIYIKRSDLIPNLVDTVKQYMSFEESTLEKITAMRTIDSKRTNTIEKEGTKALNQALIQVENYPELKANTQFTNLQYSWNEVEEQISAGRRYISTSITQYNDTVTTFPGNVIASLTGFSVYEWQYATKQEQQNVRASKLFTNKN